MKSCAEFFLFSIFCFSSFFSGCKKYPEMTLEEIDAFRSSASDGILSKTISKPFKDEGWKIGKNGGVWNGTISADGNILNEKTLEIAVVKAIAENPDVRIHIIADKDTPYKYVNQTLAVLEALQHRVVSFVVKEK